LKGRKAPLTLTDSAGVKELYCFGSGVEKEEAADINGNLDCGGLVAVVLARLNGSVDGDADCLKAGLHLELSAREEAGRPVPAGKSSVAPQ
jgi:hypothetical protein